ncbi:MAG: acetyl-CoA C-acetyltransferase [Pontimonas sp.]|jgi:acetyl-CoA C-acetyltransferase
MSVIASYKRTPFGRLLGSLSTLSASELGAVAVRAALEAVNVAPQDVDISVVGHVLQAGTGQNPGRQTAVASGIPLNVPAITLNAVCLSGMEAITYGHRMIHSGEASIVVCVGQESMSNAPHVMRNSRTGTKYGSMEVVDSLELDGLTDAFGQCSMGISTEEGNSQRGWGREAQDSWAALSHQRASTNIDFLSGEIAPVALEHRKGTVVVDSDEAIRGETTVETLAELRPAFAKGRTITAGNASPISDGAACVVLMSEEMAKSSGIHGIARIISHAFVAGPDTQLHSQPSSALTAALAKVDKNVAECRALEINEAFASVVLQSITDLDVDKTLVNRRGGAIALGHPIGTSGIRIVGTLAREISLMGPGTLGGAGICGGGGQGSAIILEAV